MRRDLTLAIVAVAVMIFNMADAHCTIQWSTLGMDEANPLMAALLHGGWFLPVKAAVGSLGVVALWLARGSVLARIGLWAALVAYSAVMAAHCWIAFVIV